MHKLQTKNVKTQVNELENQVDKQTQAAILEPGIHAPITPDNPAGIAWVEIPAGEFLFGGKNEKINMKAAYKIGKYPITNAQYKKFLDSNKDYKLPKSWDVKNRTYPEEKANYPVVFLTWDDAQVFCEWAKCRLPSDKEWRKQPEGRMVENILGE